MFLPISLKIANISNRFADKQLGYRERKLALSNLIQTYLSTFADIGVETWLMHGTLLGWWWNRKVGQIVSIAVISLTLADPTMGFRLRCPSFRSLDALSRLILQYVRLPLQDSSNT